MKSPIASIGVALAIVAGLAANNVFAQQAPGKRNFEQGTAMLVGGQRAWVRYPDLWSESGDFEQIGAAFDGTGGSRSGPIGQATAKLMSQSALVDFGAKWIRENRR